MRCRGQRIAGLDRRPAESSAYLVEASFAIVLSFMNKLNDAL